MMMPQCKAAAGCLRCFMHPSCPRNRCASISGRIVRRYSIAQAVIQRLRHQHPRCSLRHSNGLHPSMMPQRKAAAGCLRCFKHPSCPRNRCATISALIVRRYSIAHAVIQRLRHQHPRCSLRHSNGLHPSMMPQRKAAAECRRCFKHPSCPQNRCATNYGRIVRRYSIA
jgi:DNA-binding cell septation regulator SpoVG